MKHHLTLTILGFLLCFQAMQLAGQGDPLLRIEIETKSDEARYRVIPCNETGTVLFYKTTVSEDMYDFWVFVLYNKMLNETWKQDIPFFENMNFADHVLLGNTLYCFFHDPEKKKSAEYNFQLAKINLAKGSYELYSGLLPIESKFVDFKVIDNTIIVGLNLDTDHSGIYTFNLTSREILTRYEILDKDSRCESLFVDPGKKTCHAIFNIYENKNLYYLQVYEFDLLGQELLSLKLLPEPGKKFNTGKIATVSGNVKLVFGTYGLTKGSSIDSKDYFIKEAAGFYTVNISDPDNLVLRHQNFLDLENMTGYLKSKEYQLAKRKAEKTDDAGDKEKYSVTYDMLLHDPIERDSLFYFVGEAFFENYHTVTNTYYDYYGRAVPVSYSVFDGYRYFNAFISCYDYNGNKLWDNGMEIYNILTFDLKNRVSVYFSGDETVLSYNREGKISSKIINGPVTVDGVDNFPLETTYVNDKVIEDTKSNMVHWYDNYFLAYGFETIRNNSLGDKSKRTVFYINKVAFQ